MDGCARTPPPYNRPVDVPAIQAALGEQGLDGWLLYDFRGSNTIARRVVGLPDSRLTSRRWLCFVPRRGEPVTIVSSVERHVLDLPGRSLVYTSWRELEAALREALAGSRTVAMEVSPLGAVPTASRVDWGTVELVRSLGPDVVGSADLVQLFAARWTPTQRASHDRAARAVERAKDAAFARVAEALGTGEELRESEVQAFVMAHLDGAGLVADHPCCVAVNDHAADPHFGTAPGPDDRPVRGGDTLLLDVWGKEASPPDAVYADITWMAYCGTEPPARLAEVWQAVAAARDAAIALVTEATAAGRPLHGYEVDRAARGELERRGLAGFFVHRTGHSLGTEVHADGVNLDDLETRDDRLVLPGLGFTIEPGVYLPGELGVRSEVDVHVGHGRAEVTTEVQRALVLLG